MIVANQEITSIFNWSLIEKSIVPDTFINVEENEDFELLFMVNIDEIKLKETLRSSQRPPGAAVRKFLWKRILLRDEGVAQSTIKSYNEKKSRLFGKDLDIQASLPNFVDTNHLIYYYLNDEGKQALCRILNVLNSAHPDIIFAPLLVPLGSLFLHYMEEDEAYACIVEVAESKNKITQTDIHWATTNHVFRCFSQKYAHAAYDYVLDAMYKNVHDAMTCMETIDSWMWWIFGSLPYEHVINIVDSFLLEGQKVIYRYGIAILDSYYKSLRTNRPEKLEPTFMNTFCQQFGSSFDSINKSAFGYRNMSKKNIEEVFNREENVIKKLLEKTKNREIKPEKLSKKNSIIQKFQRKNSTSTSPSFVKSQLIEKCEIEKENKFYKTDGLKETSSSKKIGSFTVKDAFKNIGLRSNTSQARIKEKKWHADSHMIHNHSFYHNLHPQSSLNLPSFSLENTGSVILRPSQIAQIWKWLPNRYQILEQQLIYSSNIHGSRLMTLMDKIEFYEGTIIIIQSMTNQIFGAFCTTPWSERMTKLREGQKKASFFGNGETFLFEVSPRVVKYEWVGKKYHGEVDANQELFMYADKEYLAVGGSTTEGHGFGLFINNCLTNGRSSVSDTFENGVLGGETEFEIQTIEVIGFLSSC